MILSYLPGSLLIFALLWILHRTFRTYSLYPFFWWGLALKTTSGVLLGILYFHYYKSGDTISYMDDAVLLRQFAVDDFGSYLKFLWTDSLPVDMLDKLTYYIESPRALFFSKLVSILNLAFFNHYYLLSIFVSLLSFGSFFYLAEMFTLRFRNSKPAAVVALLFAPSVVFWSSGLIKECIAMSAICLIIGMALSKAFNGRPFKMGYWLTLILLFTLVWKLKYYYGAVLIPTFFASWFIYAISGVSNHPLWNRFRVLTWFGILLVGIGVFSSSQINLQFKTLPAVIKQNHDAFINKSEQGDFIVYHNLEASWGSILRNAPKAVLSGLFRPFFTDANTGFKWITALENAVLLFLLLWNLPQLPHALRSADNLWITAAIVYVVVLATFLALSTPNLGTLTRYKAGFSFIFTYVILYNHPIFAIIHKTMARWKNPSSS